MAFKLESLSAVDKETECLIFGFVRQSEVEIDNIIPPLISWTCLMFYWMNEYFEIICDKINVSEDKLSLIAGENVRHGNNASFGAQKINSTNPRIYKWTLSNVGNNLIGLTDSNRTITNLYGIMRQIIML